jgi:hypothetical protein
VGLTYGMLRAAVAGADAPEAFSLLFLRDFFSEALTSSAAFSASLFDLSGGVEGLDDDRRRWWLGLKGCCAVLIAARPTALVGTALIALVERKALPSAGENMASGGGVLVVVLVVDWLIAAQSCCRRHALPLS